MMPKLSKSEIETLLFFESLGGHWLIVGNHHAMTIRSLHKRGLVDACEMPNAWAIRISDKGKHEAAILRKERW